MKRKHETEDTLQNGSVTKVPKKNAPVDSDFAAGLLSRTTIEKYTGSYASSGPYKHAVVQPLISDDLLRSVRKEIIDNIHFTPKETDIYRIFQSGDLANLDGLPESALSRLPSLLRLRDALYSPDFRSWISKVSGAGPVSGKKTDMAINVYKPGCHLLCHDDVIGSRRVSYILYLTDPDRPWKAGWGGALRLYPTEQKVTEDGRKVKVPDPQWTKVIPPAWNQLSFFAVQPGESFHDVEEVYHQKEGEEEDDGGRVRMAISGWFHIPQEGEDGYEEGLEEKLAGQSSLQQLQAKNDALDLPQLDFVEPREVVETAAGDDEDEDEGLSQADLDFLLKFMTPQYLTPDTVEELNDLFNEESSLQLANILSTKIISRLKSQILELEHLDQSNSTWSTASPPHKHRYLYRKPDPTLTPSEDDILSSIINVFLPSTSFHKWLSLATGLSIGPSAHLARRFRKGVDYTLATAHEDDNMQLEWCLNLAPSKGWTGTDPSGEDGEDTTPATSNGNNTTNPPGPTIEGEDPPNPGGYELYMAADDADDAASDADSDSGVPLPSHAGQQPASSSTGGGHRRQLHKSSSRSNGKKADPAVYKAAGGEDEDDGILFTNPAGWNSLSVVLRDKGTLRFVKYVSRNAPGDRWDVVGCAEVEGGESEDEEEGEEAGEEDDEDEDGDEDGEE
ncbi:Oxoglutarate and iron-dependent oxygenase degradation C-term-domain-containing protein [Elsinoe ampelina]|uniref:uS12 prolyl 3,4-dihydroxylase n=1 Tax=Elsinoe ampelina TaxID=302913 RepID=A0A6A6GLM7_9PEZI|nr:Oxoglutarate and iron-dependent oxygenase degradation C-term-domain-containing protein [Elsinoe ampelina]